MSRARRVQRRPFVSYSAVHLPHQIHRILHFTLAAAHARTPDELVTSIGCPQQACALPRLAHACTPQQDLRKELSVSRQALASTLDSHNRQASVVRLAQAHAPALQKRRPSSLTPSHHRYHRLAPADTSTVQPPSHSLQSFILAAPLHHIPFQACPAQAKRYTLPSSLREDDHHHHSSA